MCGEKSTAALNDVELSGSPPRVRGEAKKAAIFSLYTRITPACAGRSDDLQRPGEMDQDHPRVCGEKPSLPINFPLTTGSPPRVRGEGSERNRNYTEDGITPACAGRSFYRHGIGTCTRDHPRVCGEKHDLHIFSCTHQGSPPRVRGEVGGLEWPEADKRITPACAGRRRRRCRKFAESKDHPRVCGEKRTSS